MKINELNGRKMKKDIVDCSRCIKRYHNKHVDGSGNFGFTVVVRDKWFTIDGNYDSEGNVHSLSYGLYAYGTRKTKADDDYNTFIAKFNKMVEDYFTEKVAEELSKC